MVSSIRVSRLEASRRFILIGALLIWGLASARTIHVPSKYGSVQAAIDAAAEGDEVVVAPGRYVENIQFRGKNIVLRSQDPLSTPVVAATILDGNGVDSVVTLSGTETTSCVLEGFTITQGNAYVGGGGVAGNYSTANIEYNVIEGNLAGTGGGIWGCNGLIYRNIIQNNLSLCGPGGLAQCYGTIRENVIQWNITDSSYTDWMPLDCPGGGGGLGQCTGLIEKNIIRGNEAHTISWIYPSWPHEMINVSRKDGGGLWLCGGIIRDNLIEANLVSGKGGGLFGCGGNIYNNLIIDNWAWYGGGLYGCSGLLENNVILRNSASQDTGGCSQWAGTFRNNIVYWNDAPTTPQMAPTSLASYNCIQDWPTTVGLGNITSDPGFVDAANNDFHLRPDSPCIDAGGTALDVLTDYDGAQRPMKGWNGTPSRGDGSGWDIGAFEYPGPLLPLPTAPPGDIVQTILKERPTNPYMDVNGDGTIDAADVILALIPGK